MFDSRFRKGVVAVGAAAGLTLAGIGYAAAQSDTPNTTTPPAAQDRQRPERGPMMKRHLGGPGMKMGGIHGEFTTRNAAGDGWQKIATQLGDVTAVDRDSIKVKSEDGYEKSYNVNDNTLVNAGNNGIDDVKVGDKVHVTAQIVDGKYNAVDVHDVTQIKDSMDRWRPGRPEADSAEPADL
jgi:hypothetical protein